MVELLPIVPRVLPWRKDLLDGQSWQKLLGEAAMEKCLSSCIAQVPWPWTCGGDRKMELVTRKSLKNAAGGILIILYVYICNCNTAEAYCQHLKQGNSQ